MSDRVRLGDCPNGELLKNRRLIRWQVGAFALLWLVATVFVVLTVYSIRDPTLAGGFSGVEFTESLSVSWLLFAVGLTLWNVRFYRRSVPDQLSFGGDFVVGTYHHHFLGFPEGTTVRVPLADVARSWPEGPGAYGEYTPARIGAEWGKPWTLVHTHSSTDGTQGEQVVSRTRVINMTNDCYQRFLESQARRGPTSPLSRSGPSS